MKDMNSYFEGSSVEFQKWWDEKDHSRDKELTPYSHSGVGWEAGYNAAIKELENPQIATVIDPDSGFTINGPEWLQLPLKARLIIQELSLHNDALKAEQEWQDMASAPKDDLVLLAQAGNVYLGWWEADVGWLQSDTCQSLNLTHWKHLPKPPTE